MQPLILNILSNYLKPFFVDPKLLFVPLLLAIIAYWFAHKLKNDELLFSSRKEAYSDFMKEYGKYFHPMELEMDALTDEVKTLGLKYTRTQKMGHVFSSCRLLAGYYLEKRLRDLYDLIEESEDTKNFNSDQLKLKQKERVYVGVEVETLMRRDLRAIGIIITCFELISIYIIRVDIHIKLKSLSK
jgi:hypothetical protein